MVPLMPLDAPMAKIQEFGGHTLRNLLGSALFLRAFEHDALPRKQRRDQGKGNVVATVTGIHAEEASRRGRGGDLRLGTFRSRPVASAAWRKRRPAPGACGRSQETFKNRESTSWAGVFERRER